MRNIKFISKGSGKAKATLFGQANLYFCKTSGTTSGVKHIPIFKNAIKTHTNSARDSILNYILNTGIQTSLRGKQIFIQGSPILKTQNGIKIGRLSGIVAHHVPFYLRRLECQVGMSIV